MRAAMPGLVSLSSQTPMNRLDPRSLGGKGAIRRGPLSGDLRGGKLPVETAASGTAAGQGGDQRQDGCCYRYAYIHGAVRGRQQGHLRAVRYLSAGAWGGVVSGNRERREVPSRKVFLGLGEDECRMKPDTRGNSIPCRHVDPPAVIGA